MNPDVEPLVYSFPVVIALAVIVGRLIKPIENSADVFEDDERSDRNECLGVVYFAGGGICAIFGVICFVVMPWAFPVLPPIVVQIGLYLTAGGIWFVVFGLLRLRGTGLALGP